MAAAILFTPRTLGAEPAKSAALGNPLANTSWVSLCQNLGRAAYRFSDKAFTLELAVYADSDCRVRTETAFLPGDYQIGKQIGEGAELNLVSGTEAGTIRTFHLFKIVDGHLVLSQAALHPEDRAKVFTPLSVRLQRSALGGPAAIDPLREEN